MMALLKPKVLEAIYQNLSSWSGESSFDDTTHALFPRRVGPEDLLPSQQCNAHWQLDIIAEQARHSSMFELSAQVEETTL